MMMRLVAFRVSEGALIDDGCSASQEAEEERMRFCQWADLPKHIALGARLLTADNVAEGGEPIESVNQEEHL